MDLDAHPLAAYLATLVLHARSGGVSTHRIRTVARDEEHLRRRFHEDALRRTHAHYRLDQELPAGDGWEVAYSDGEPQLTVDWGNVASWELTDLARGGTWVTKERPPS